MHRQCSGVGPVEAGQTENPTLSRTQHRTSASKTMATINRASISGQLHGKVGGLVYSLQRDGTTTVRSVGEETAPSTPGEKKGQRRMQLAHAYVRSVLDDPELWSVYDPQARAVGMRVCDLAMSDFLTDPVILGVNADRYRGLAGDSVIIIAGDNFKIVRLGVVIRDAQDRRIEEGFAIPVEPSLFATWLYTTQKDLPPGQVVTLEVTGTDRCGHSTVKRVPRQI